MDELRIPGDPHGIEEAHDVLAADEFAMPSGPDRIAETAKSGGASSSLKLFGAAALAVLLYRAVKRR